MQQIYANGQVSIEYLLILAAFFSVLALMFPIISYSTEQMFYANDAIVAKQISQNLDEQISLFELLGNGSKKEIEFNAIKEIILETKSNILTIKTNEKIFVINLPNNQETKSSIFNSKFVIFIEKNNNNILIDFYEKEG